MRRGIFWIDMVSSEGGGVIIWIERVSSGSTGYHLDGEGIIWMGCIIWIGGVSSGLRGYHLNGEGYHLN
jgi:hypothetical protein